MTTPSQTPLLLAFTVALVAPARAQGVLPRPEQPFGGRINVTPEERREFDDVRGRGVMAE